jgi:hypothetical protein
MVDPHPSLNGSISDFAGTHLWPSTSALMVFVRPLQDLSNSEIRKILSVSHAAVFSEQPRQRRASGAPLSLVDVQLREQFKNTALMVLPIHHKRFLLFPLNSQRVDANIISYVAVMLFLNTRPIMATTRATKSSTPRALPTGEQLQAGANHENLKSPHPTPLEGMEWEGLMRKSLRSLQPGSDALTFS